MLAMKWALRDLRGGLRGLRLLFGCLLVGVFAIAGVGSLSEAIITGLQQQGQSILGGDLEIELSQMEATPEQQAAFPNTPLTPLLKTITDPERVRDTTVYLSADPDRGIHAATSTSGWAWKYPGRLGDSPIPGAGFYADSRYGAAACTHTGEMTMRCATSRTVVLAMKLGYSLGDAVKLAVEELSELSEGFLGGVVIHALDAQGNHEVVNFRCPGDIRYWLWTPDMPEPELRDAKSF